MFKRISVIFLTLIYAVSIFAYTGVSAKSDIETPDNCLGLLAAIGADIRIENPDVITRGEFVSLLAQCLNGTASGGDLPFSDVSADSFFAPYVKYALDTGIISSAPTFNPYQPIKYAEACKMTVSALGRDYYAVLKGGWPTGYIAAADACDLTDGVTYAETMSGADALTLLWNFMHTPVMEMTGVSADGGNVSNYVEGESVLAYYHNVYYAEGVVTADKYTGLYESDSRCEQNETEISEKIYKSTKGVSGFIGQNVVAYAVVEGNSADVIYAYPSENYTLTIDSDDIGQINGNSVSYLVGDFEKKLTLSASPAYIYNRCADKTYSADMLADENCEITFIDNNGDKKYDVVYISSCDTMIVSSVNIYDEIIIGEKNELITIDDEAIYEVYLDGKPGELKDIENGKLLEIYRSRDGMVTVVEAYPENVISGMVSAISAEDNKIYIDDVEYEYNTYFKNNYLADCSLGKTITAALTSDGVVAAITKSEDTILYGYVIATKTPDSGSGLDDEVLVKMLSQKGEIGIYTFAKKVKIDGVNVAKENVAADDFENSLIRYRATSENVIIMIDTEEVSEKNVLNGDEAADDKLIRFGYPSNVYSTIWYIQGTSMWHPYFRSGASTPVFVVVNDENLDEEKRFTISNSTYFNSIKYSKPASLVAYNVEETGDAGAIVIYRDEGSSNIDSSSVSGVVYSANRAINENGEEGVSLVIFKNKNFSRLFVSDENVFKSLGGSFADIPVTAGDYVRVSVNSENVVGGIARDFDYSEGKIDFSFINHIDDISYYYGMLYDKKGSYISIIPENVSGNTNGLEKANERYRFSVPAAITVFDTETNSVFTGTSDEMITYLQGGTDCSKVIIKTSDGLINDVVLYK